MTEKTCDVPIITGGSRGDTEHKSIEVELPQARIFIPDHGFEIRGFLSSSGDVLVGVLLELVDHFVDHDEGSTPLGRVGLTGV